MKNALCVASRSSVTLCGLGLALCGVATSQLALGQTKTGTAKTGATKTSAAKADLLVPSSLKAKAPEIYVAKFTTTKGDIVVRVTRAWAPLGADRFYNLVRAGFFTDAAFFRVIPGFMAQFGISAKPAVAAAWMNANIQDDPVTQSNKRGMLTFATAGPNTRTTQLFINYGNNVTLDPQGFAPFGEVIEGMDVVDKINSEYQEQPNQNSIQKQGKAYLDKSFPRLDRITAAVIVPPAPAMAPKAADAKK